MLKTREFLLMERCSVKGALRSRRGVHVLPQSGMSVYLSVCRAYLTVCLSACISVRLTLGLLFALTSVNLSVGSLFICLSVALFV